MDQTPCTIFRSCFAQKLGLDAVWFGTWPQMDRGHFDTHLLILGICQGEAPPSCCARLFCRLKAPLGLSLLRCAAQTRTFEIALFSAACKKKRGKLWQKERGLDGASPLDRSRYADFYFMPAHPPGAKAAMPEGTSSPARRCS